MLYASDLDVCILKIDMHTYIITCTVIIWYNAPIPHSVASWVHSRPLTQRSFPPPSRPESSSRNKKRSLVRLAVLSGAKVAFQQIASSCSTWPSSGRCCAASLRSRPPPKKKKTCIVYIYAKYRTYIKTSGSPLPCHGGDFAINIPSFCGPDVCAIPHGNAPTLNKTTIIRWIQRHSNPCWRSIGIDPNPCLLRWWNQSTEDHVFGNLGGMASVEQAEKL